MKRAYLQLSNDILLLKFGREINFKSLKDVINSSPEMSSTTQLAQGRTEKLYGVICCTSNEPEATAKYDQVL